MRLFVFAVAEERVESFRLHSPDGICDPMIHVAVIGIKTAGPCLAPGTLDEKLNLGSSPRLAFNGL